VVANLTASKHSRFL